MILQRGSTIKVSIELPVATRHRRDMTEILLKATLNPNSHTQLILPQNFFIYFYQSQIFISALFVNKNLLSYSGLFFSKLQQKFSFKIHVNLAPD